MNSTNYYYYNIYINKYNYYRYIIVVEKSVENFLQKNENFSKKSCTFAKNFKQYNYGQIQKNKHWCRYQQ